MCGCGETESCGAPGLRCYCDNNDDVWRTDEGHITYKDDLPVKGFCAGDTGSLHTDSTLLPPPYTNIQTSLPLL